MDNPDNYAGRRLLDDVAQIQLLVVTLESEEAEATSEVLSMAAAASSWLQSKYPDATAADVVSLTALVAQRRNQGAREILSRERLSTKRARP